MFHRINHSQQSPELFKKLFELSAAVSSTDLTQTLRDLVNIRASQLNGCALCLDMHVKEAKIHGERELRVYHVSIWRESPLFSERERAALEWTEAVTKLGEPGVSDEIYARVRAQFSEKELSNLTYAVGVINLWNRLGVSFQGIPGSYDGMLGLAKAGLS